MTWLDLTAQAIGWFNHFVLGYFLFSALFGWLALLIPSRLYKLIALVAMFTISVVGFIWLGRHTPEAKQSGEEPQNSPSPPGS